jgi:CRP-like cAMP-binding protein
MTMKVFDPGHYIYTRNDQSEQIMFVKEGVVLLERSVLLNS